MGLERGHWYHLYGTHVGLERGQGLLICGDLATSVPSSAERAALHRPYYLLPPLLLCYSLDLSNGNKCLNKCSAHVFLRVF